MATTSGQNVLPQGKAALLNTYQKRLKEAVKAMGDNYTEILKLARVPDNEPASQQVKVTTQIEQDMFEMQVRAANIVRAAENLTQLVSDIKQFLILNDFPSLNEAINQKNSFCRDLQQQSDGRLLQLRDQLAADLYELEEDYYSSSQKQA